MVLPLFYWFYLAAAYHFCEDFLTRVDALSLCCCLGETAATKMLVLASPAILVAFVAVLLTLFVLLLVIILCVVVGVYLDPEAF